jgi:hypothetical protein
MPLSISGDSPNFTNATLTTSTLTSPTINSAQVPTVSGSAPLYMCRAWVNFDGTGTVAIRASGNVSSITDNGTGDYTVNFTVAMPDANYCVTSSSTSQTGSNLSSVSPNYVSSTLTAPTTTALKVGTQSPVTGAALDVPYVYIAVFR